MCDKATISIYGAGKYGKVLCEMLHKLNTKVDYFIQSKVEDNEFIDEIPIISVEKIV